MRTAITAAASGLLLMLGAACGRATYDVHTMVAPEAALAQLHSFRLLPVPPRRDGRGPVGAYDPMVSNSITNAALRDAIATALVARGYVIDETQPDFEVAVYASAHEELDVTLWDYGYPHWPVQRGGRLPGDRVETYTAGTVVVDMIDPPTRELWWRGSGTARMTEDPDEDMKELRKVAREIVRRFPPASRRMLAQRR
jgi:hypothetical protein